MRSNTLVFKQLLTSTSQQIINSESPIQFHTNHNNTLNLEAPIQSEFAKEYSHMSYTHIISISDLTRIATQYLPPTLNIISEPFNQFDNNNNTQKPFPYPQNKQIKFTSNVIIELFLKVKNQ
eukprot:457900_1